MKTNSVPPKTIWPLILQTLAICTMIVTNLTLIDNLLTPLTVIIQLQLTESEVTRGIPGRREGAGSY